MVGLPRRPAHSLRRWKQYSFAVRFVLLGGVYTLAAMVICGVLIATFLSDTFVKRRGGDIAALGQRILAPAMRGYVPGESLPPEAASFLTNLMSDPVLSAEFPLLRIWSADLDIMYANTPLPPPASVPPAEVVKGFDAGAATVKFPMSERGLFGFRRRDNDPVAIFFPLRNASSGQIIAVAELQDVRVGLQRDLNFVATASWVAVTCISLIVMIGLFVIGLQGARTVERQRALLAKRLQQFRSRATRYRHSKDVAEEATRNVTLLTERYLRNIGTDLHDGPAQTIGLAVLKLDGVRSKSRAAQRSAAISDVEAVLGDAMAEIRDIAMALVLPEIDRLDIAQVINNAAARHLRRTGGGLMFDNQAEPVQLPADVSVCVFRFVQEGLNNAFKHGLAGNQTLTARTEDGLLKLAISNHYDEHASPVLPQHIGIGLYSLRTRVQSLGGTFSFVRNNGLSRLEMWLPLQPHGKQPE
ncbi:MAG TPA: histidine kinase [Devosia sp.]|jgi:signal transduction histidine kinase|uniref:sensor histidine kinase n=1 Tax=Devosia sp. TaxID=1871048 RepID=UPI002F92BA85